MKGSHFNQDTNRKLNSLERPKKNPDYQNRNDKIYVVDGAL